MINPETYLSYSHRYGCDLLSEIKHFILSNKTVCIKHVSPLDFHIDVNIPDVDNKV